MNDEEDDFHSRIQLQKLEALGRFAGGMAHDFNNILSIIEGHTHIAIKHLKEGKLKIEQLEKLLAATQRGAGLTRQLLAFAKQKVDFESHVDLGVLLMQQQVLLAPLLGENITLNLQVPEHPVQVAMSSDQLTQIVLNLALNARDSMEDGGQIDIQCVVHLTQNDLPAKLRQVHSDDASAFIRVEFSDTGAGIAPDRLSSIFDPFYTTKGVESTGLGLSVVHGIIEQIAGHIDVTSELGQGTVFSVYLPMTQDLVEDEGCEEEEGTQTCLSGKTVLLAEDEDELRDVLAVMLEDMEMKVLKAANGNYALMLQEDYEGDIDFLLTDIVMPGMSGIHLAEMFLSLRPESNVVLMSGYPFLDENKNLSLPQDIPLLNKPIQQDSVRRILERATQRQKKRQQPGEGARS